MSDQLIASLNQRITELTEQKAKLNRALKESRQETKAKTTELAELLEKADGEFSAFDTEKEELTRQIEEWKQKATAAPDEQARRIQELESALRTRDYRDAFREAVGPELGEGVTVEDLWHFGQFDPAKVDNLTPEQITELVGKVKEAKPILFAKLPDGGTGQSPPAQSGAPARPALKVGEGTPASRGARDTASGQVRYRREDTTKPGWMTTNRALADAISNGTAVLID